MTLEGGGRSAVSVQGNAATGGARLDRRRQPDGRQRPPGVMAIEDTSQPQAIAPR